MRLWAIFKTILFLTALFYLIKMIAGKTSAATPPPNQKPKKPANTNRKPVIFLEETGKGKLPDGTEYTQYE